MAENTDPCVPDYAILTANKTILNRYFHDVPPDKGRMIVASESNEPSVKRVELDAETDGEVTIIAKHDAARWKGALDRAATCT
ncbi:MAG: hypothetical protein AAFR96_02750 [Planctomycetota bacterium]